MEMRIEIPGEASFGGESSIITTPGGPTFNLSSVPGTGASNFVELTWVFVEVEPIEGGQGCDA